MKTEITIKEIADRFGPEKKVILIGEDDELAVFVYKKHQAVLPEENYSFEVGM